MNVFRLPELSAIPRLTCLFAGRMAEPRPDPRGLTPLLGIPAHAPAELPIARLQQVHSYRCLAVTRDTDGLVGEGDALATDRSGIALAIATADCLPIVLVDPVAPALAVVHAGWRGTLAGVMTEAIRTLTTDFGARAHRMHAGVGPGVGACCYSVGDEVAGAFSARHPEQADSILRRRPDGRIHLDLTAANRLQALRAGVSAERFHALNLCTVCRPDICHSYRVDGERSGRMWLLAALTPG